eukprot:2715085-Prymnesium_polylepis.1
MAGRTAVDAADDMEYALVVKLYSLLYLFSCIERGENKIKPSDLAGEIESPHRPEVFSGGRFHPR